MPVIYPSSIPDPEYVLVPEGEYAVEVGEVERAQTRAGDEMWKIVFRITKGEFLGCKIFTNLVFVEKALGNIKVFCKAAGFDMDVDRLELRPESIEHATLRVSIVHETYEGKVRAKVPYAGFMPLDTLPAKPTQSDPYAIENQGTVPTATQKAPGQARLDAGAQNFGSDDIPF